jgi:hypothetical protein
MKNSNWKNATALMLTFLIFVVALGWRANGQARSSALPAQPRWEYRYDTASNSFPAEGDKAKIDFYGVNGWELVAVVREQNSTVLVFKRLGK